MRYFRRRWDESRGDEHDDWGASWWYLETDELGSVSRQIEAYDTGPTLRYGEEHPEDSDGAMASEPLDLNEFAPHEVGADVFEMAWSALKPRWDE